MQQSIKRDMLGTIISVLHTHTHTHHKSCSYDTIRHSYCTGTAYSTAYRTAYSTAYLKKKNGTPEKNEKTRAISDRPSSSTPIIQPYRTSRRVSHITQQHSSTYLESMKRRILLHPIHLGGAVEQQSEIPVLQISPALELAHNRRDAELFRVPEQQLARELFVEPDQLQDSFLWRQGGSRRR